MDPTKGIKFCSVCGAGADDSLPRKEVISVQPGDVVVLTNPHGVSMAQQDLAEADLKRMFPDNESLFLSNGVTLEVYREQEKTIQRPEGFCELYLKACSGSLCKVGAPETCLHREKIVDQEVKT
jgi:hypothetical protein